MGIVYLIENDQNNKKYVGITTRNIERRWKEHLRNHKTDIGKAIADIGKEHFLIRVIDECPDEELDEKEIYWIKHYNSFNEGYNKTAGGRNDNLIVKYNVFPEVKRLWQEGKGQSQIAKELGINIETVHNYLLKGGITTKDIKERHRQEVGKSKARSIVQLDLGGNFIKQWDSIISIERAGIASRSTIGRCLSKTRTAGNGYKWIYIEDYERSIKE